MPQCLTLVDTQWMGWRLMWVLLLLSSSSVDLGVLRHVTCFFFSSSPTIQGTYWTIHITPEPEFSYVSFETNLSQTSYDDLVRRVVDVFKPGKLVTTLFVNQVCDWEMFVASLWRGVYALSLRWLSFQSSKCRSVFSSAQKLEGYKRLDRQLAQFNDYNFVFTSYAQQNQQSWGCTMKRRKKKGGLSASTQPLSLCLYISPWRSHRCTGCSWAVAATSPLISFSFSCLHCATCNLNILHESSSLCFAILAHSCCDLEVHVEEVNRLCLRPSTSATQYNGPFLQVSPLILNRQGFRAHSAWAPDMLSTALLCTNQRPSSVSAHGNRISATGFLLQFHCWTTLHQDIGVRSFVISWKFLFWGPVPHLDKLWKWM